MKRRQANLFCCWSNEINGWIMKMKYCTIIHISTLSRSTDIISVQNWIFHVSVGFISLHIQNLIHLRGVVCVELHVYIDDSIVETLKQPINKNSNNLLNFHLTSSIKLRRCIRFCSNRAFNDVIIFITTCKVQKSLVFICSKFIIDNEKYVIFVLSHDLIFCNRRPIFTS